MSLLGKILAIMNILVAILVMVLANMDWGVHQGWHFAVFERKLMIVGLPVDESERFDDNPDEPLARELTPGVRATIFQNAKGGNDLGFVPPAPNFQVKTVNEELDRVAAKINSNVAGQPNPDAQKKLLKIYLLPLARTLGERDELRKLIDVPGGETAGQAEVTRRFNAAKIGANKGGAGRKEFRANAAFVLGNVGFGNPGEAADWHQRVVTVVGMEAYVDGVVRQAEALEQIAADIKHAMTTDQAKFLEDYGNWTQEIVRDSEQLYKALQFKAELTAELAERKRQTEIRTTERDQAQKNLADATAAAEKEIAQMRAIQKDLFNFQQKYIEAMKKNLDLENELRKSEQKR